MLGHVVLKDKGVMSCLYAFHHLSASERDFYTCQCLRYGNNEKKNGIYLQIKSLNFMNFFKHNYADMKDETSINKFCRF